MNDDIRICEKCAWFDLYPEFTEDGYCFIDPEHAKKWTSCTCSRFCPKPVPDCSTCTHRALFDDRSAGLMCGYSIGCVLGKRPEPGKGVFNPLSGPGISYPPFTCDSYEWDGGTAVANPHEVRRSPVGGTEEGEED